MAGEKFGVFAREDVVGYGGEGVGGAKGEAEGEHEGCFAGAYGAVFKVLVRDSKRGVVRRYGMGMKKGLRGRVEEEGGNQG